MIWVICETKYPEITRTEQLLIGKELVVETLEKYRSEVSNKHINRREKLKHGGMVLKFMDSKIHTKQVLAARSANEQL